MKIDEKIKMNNRTRKKLKLNHLKYKYFESNLWFQIFISMFSFIILSSYSYYYAFRILIRFSLLPFLLLRHEKLQDGWGCKLNSFVSWCNQVVVTVPKVASPLSSFLSSHLNSDITTNQHVQVQLVLVADYINFLLKDFIWKLMKSQI